MATRTGSRSSRDSEEPQVTQEDVQAFLAAAAENKRRRPGYTERDAFYSRSSRRAARKRSR